jgi:glycosyltransferase involved in cell wall biosynthesis
MAYIISRITGIPWSLTLHRFDIYENNLLGRKARSASFVRCISEKGKTDLLKIVGDEFSSKVKAIHMGVEVPNKHRNFIKTLDSNNNGNNFKKSFIFCVPANLVPVKGHKYLLEACTILVQKGVKFKCIFCGDGPLKDELKRLIQKRGLEAHVNLYGVIPHDQLMHMYEKKEVDIVILPSITTENGEFEGIPVALMEAMAFGIPVISTDTGGIPELLGDGSGIMVKEKDPKAIADSIEKLMNNPTFYSFISGEGRKKIERDFNGFKIAEKLLELFLQHTKD